MLGSYTRVFTVVGLSTINRELAIQLAKFPEVKITFFLPKCSQENRKIALEHKAKIVQAMPLPPAFEQLIRYRRSWSSTR